MKLELLTTEEHNEVLRKAGTTQIEANKLFNVALMDALKQAVAVDQGGHGSTARLTNVIHVAEYTRGVNVRKMQAWIMEHANVRWVKSKNSGKYHFTFKGKPAVVLPEISWWEWVHPSDKAKPDIDLVKQLRFLLNKASKEGVVVKDDKNILPELRDLAVKFGVQWNHTPKKEATGKTTKHRQPA